MTFLEGLFGRFGSTAERLPAWLKPAFWGAAMIPMMVVLRMGGLIGVPIITAIFVYKSGPIAILWVLGLFGLAIIAGGVGGLVFSLLSPLSAFSLPGQILQCSLAVCAYAEVAFALVEQI